MSRAYEIQVTVREYVEENADDILAAIGNCGLDTGDARVAPEEIWLLSETSIGGGWTEQDYADELSARITQANASACQISVMATCLESLPYGEYEYGKEETGKLLAKMKGERSEE